MADGASAKLQHHILAEVVDQLVHLPRMNPAGRDRHHLAQRGPVLVEEQTVLQARGRARLAQRVVEALDHERIAFELADHGAGMDVIDAGHAHPLADDAEVHAVVLLARIGGITGAMQVQNHVVLARPLRHRLDRGVADDQVDHDDGRAERARELGSFVHVFHGAGGDVEVVTLHFTGRGRSAIDRLHAVEKAVPPAHEGLAVDVLIVLDEVEAALERLVHNAAVVASRESELRLGGGAEQRPPELIQALALNDNTGGGALEGLKIGDRHAHVLQAQRLDGLEAEDIADDRGSQIRDRAFLEQIQVVGDPGEVLLLGPGAGAGVGHGFDLVGLGAIELASGQAIGPDHRPGGGRRFAGNGRGGLLRIHARLRSDAEHHHEVGFERLIIGLPVTHFDITQYSCLVAFGGGGLRGADGTDVRHSGPPLGRIVL